MRAVVVLAPNPGLLTGPGTNTWIVTSRGACLIIDPGPRIASHIVAIRRAVEGLEPAGVLVTHTHPDHAPAANGLALELGVPAMGPASSPEFSPDRTLADGDRVDFGGINALCVATPGHTPDSVSFRVGDALFSGDHIMGGSTVVVEDMTDYMASLQRLRGTGLDAIYPGHGPIIHTPDALITEYLDHRIEREQQILGAIDTGASSVGQIVAAVYHDVDPELHPAASVSVMAHLQRLRSEGRVRCAAELSWSSEVGPA